MTVDSIQIFSLELNAGFCEKSDQFLTERFDPVTFFLMGDVAGTDVMLGAWKEKEKKKIRMTEGGFSCQISGMHEKHLERAVDLAREHMQLGHGGPFGAVVVRDGQVIGEGWNAVTTGNDPTAHAEVMAIRAACAHVHDHRLAGATLYASCEPCPMCLAAAWWARVDRVVFSASREEAARAGFDDALIYEEMALPLEHRRLEMLCSHRELGQAVLEEWLRFPDKVPY